jgi:hypothetical protein
VEPATEWATVQAVRWLTLSIEVAGVALILLGCAVIIVDRLGGIVARGGRARATTDTGHVRGAGGGAIAPDAPPEDVVAGGGVERCVSMDARADADSRRRAAPNHLVVEDERQLYAQAGFTRREWQRLDFLRWLYRRGLLTEWPWRQVGPAAHRGAGGQPSPEGADGNHPGQVG